MLKPGLLLERFRLHISLIWRAGLGVRILSTWKVLVHGTYQRKSEDIFIHHFFPRRLNRLSCEVIDRGLCWLQRLATGCCLVEVSGTGSLMSKTVS